MSESARAQTLELLGRASHDLEGIVRRVRPDQELLSRPNEWNTRQILAHLVMYEERYVVQTLQCMAAGESAAGIDVTGTESDLQIPSPELANLTASEIFERLRDVELRRDEIVRSMSDAEFLTTRRSVWGPQTPQWVLEKSFGHYWEHGVTIFYIVHFHEMSKAIMRGKVRSTDDLLRLDSFDD